MLNLILQYLYKHFNPIDHRWTARELAVEVRVCHKTVLNILGYRKLAAHWIPHELYEMQQWHHYADAQALWDVDNFLE